jgi:hypothetical protein
MEDDVNMTQLTQKQEYIMLFNASLMIQRLGLCQQPGNRAKTQIFPVSQGHAPFYYTRISM